MDIKKVIDYWRKSAREDFKVAKSLFILKHYPYCLFFCHLTLEKTLKALVVQRTKKQSPYTHDLLELIKRGKIEINKEQIAILKEITTFNIRTRYSNIKLEFHKRANKKYTEKYLLITEKYLKWLSKQLNSEK